MKRLGIFRDKENQIYDLVYFPENQLAQAIGPLPRRVGVAGVHAEVTATSKIEAEKLLFEKLSGIEKQGPALVTTTTSLSGVSKTTTTTLPPELINADPDLADKDASDLIIQDNPDLKPIEQFIAQHLKPLLKGVSSEEIFENDVVKRADKAEINIKLAPNVYVIGRDAYFGQNVGSMGPTSQDMNLVVNRVWQEVKTTYDEGGIVNELRKLANKLDTLEEQVDILQDAAFLEKAANEISNGSGPKALRLLSKISKEALSVSKEIGTKIVTELIMKMTGLN